MRDLTLDEVNEVEGGNRLVQAAKAVGAFVAGFFAGSGGGESSATAANGAKVDCADGQTAHANATAAWCEK